MEMKFPAIQTARDFQFMQTHISHTLTYKNLDNQLDATTIY